jgi:hypothetical protein
MTVKITIERVTAEDLAFFSLESPGYFIARDAEKAGEMAGPADAIEVICLVNKLYEIEFRQRIALALAEHCGKDAERTYLENEDSDGATKYVVAQLGTDRLHLIMRETADYVKQESGVGAGTNEPTKAAQKVKRGSVMRPPE